MADAAGTFLFVGAAETASSLRALLKGDGLEVLVTSDGMEAVHLASTARCASVLIDLDVPGLDGLQTLRLIRSLPPERYLPVFVSSAREDRAQRIAALDLGADDWLLRPWDDQEILARVRRSLRVRAWCDARTEDTDRLTQVHTSRFFQARLVEEFRRAQRYDDPLALVLVELDAEKVSDGLLRDAAAAISRCLRDTDVISRRANQEFGLILPKTHVAGALTVGERVWKGVAALKITASVGISGHPNRMVIDAAQLAKTAEETLARARREGRNRMCVYQPPAGE